MSIDTDTSTSDTVVLMANGLAGKVKLPQFEKGLFQVCEYLTREIARNGEGVTKLITVDVSGAKTSVQAKRVAKLVANSPLVKTAVYGSDPNWGRVIMAVGKSFRSEHRGCESNHPLWRHRRFQKRLPCRLRSGSATEISQPVRSCHRRRARHRQSIGSRLGLRFDRRLREGERVLHDLSIAVIGFVARVRLAVNSIRSA